MKILLLTSLPLKSWLEQMLPASPHQMELLCLEETLCGPGQTQPLLEKADGFDALLLADGAALLGEEGLRAGGVPLVLPRVHNCAALLLGGAARYRSLFDCYQGAVCWQAAGFAAPLFTGAPAGCTCLCYLADTRLGLKDTSDSASLTARRNGWDFFETEADLSLIERMLSGDWSDERSFLVVQPGERAELSYTASLLKKSET